jgi:type I restriction enzyme R subunit
VANARAKLRTSIKRLLVKHRYPPEPAAGRDTLVLEQMEAMVPRFGEQRPAERA